MKICANLSEELLVLIEARAVDVDILKTLEESGCWLLLDIAHVARRIAWP